MTRAVAGTSCHDDDDRLLPVLRGVRPPPSCVEQAAAAEEAGLRGAVDQRPLPPVERRAGPEPVRLVGDRRDLPGRATLPVTTAVTCPTVRIHPAIIAQAAATAAVLLDGPVHPRRRHRRGAQRAHPRRPVAVGRRAAGDARGGRRADPRAVDRRGRHARRASTTRVDTRPHLHAAGRAARRSTSPASGRRRIDLAARIGDGYITTAARRRPGRAGSRSSPGGKPAQAGAKVAYAPTEDEGVGARAPALAERRPARRAGPGAAVAASTSSRPRSWSPRSRPASRWSRATTRRRTWSRSTPYARRRLRRALRRQHGPALPRHDRVLRQGDPAGARVATSSMTRWYRLWGLTPGTGDG